MQHNAEGSADDLPRVLLENYLLLAASIESQNAGRLSDMLQYSQKVHSNLLEVMQQVEAAPTLAMTAGRAGDPPSADAADADAAANTVEKELGPSSDVDAGEQAAAAAFAGMRVNDSGATENMAATGNRVTGPGSATTGAAAAAGRPVAAGLQQQQYGSRQPVDRRQQQQQQQQQQRQLPGGLSSSQQHANVQQQQQHLWQQAQHQQQPAQHPMQHLHPLHQQQQQQAAPDWLQHVSVSVSQLLQGLGLGQFVPLLEQQQVDMAALQLMEERHLRELGLPIGAVVKIRAALSARSTARAGGGGA